MRNITLAILVVITVAACNSAPEKTNYDDYQKASPLVDKEIRSRIARLEFDSGTKLLNQQRRLIYIGEPAIPHLLEGLKHESPLVRGSCAYVLGGIGDLRTLPALRDSATKDDTAAVRYEAAAALAEIGDKKHAFPVLVEGLAEKDIRLRYKCFQVLKLHTALTFGYQHDGPEAARAKSVEQWRAWAEKTFR